MVAAGGGGGRKKEDGGWILSKNFIGISKILKFVKASKIV